LLGFFYYFCDLIKNSIMVYVYDFLTDDVIKQKLMSLNPDSRIEKDDYVKRTKLRNGDIEFDFSQDKFNMFNSPNDTRSSVVIRLSDNDINKLFLREIRKYKLLKIEEYVEKNNLK